MKLLARLSLFFLLSFPLTTHAELPKQLEDDFATVEGYIIMPVGDEYLVDLDASANLQKGDILTLVIGGEKVVHPITKEVLGALDVPKGYLQVTRIKSGYSYAKLLMADAPPEKGAQVRRFEQVPALLVEEPGESSELGQELRANLSQLNWLASDSATEPLLKFVINKQNLSVKTSNDQLLHSYALVDGRPAAVSAPKPTTTGGLPEKKPQPLQKAVNTVIDTIFPKAKERDPRLGIIQQDLQAKAGIWMSPSLQGEPVGIAAADFDNDGQVEIALAMNNSIHFARNIQGDYQPLTNLAMPNGLDLLSLDTLDLDNNGIPELYLTAASQHELKSIVVEHRNGSYQIVIERIPWYLRAVNLPDLGLVLLGQRKGAGQKHFEGAPFIVTRQNQRLIAGDEILLPEYVNMFSFTSFKGVNNETLFAYLTESDYLKIATEAGEVLWESGDYFGGTETRIIPEGYDGNELLEPTYIPPRIELTAAGEFLVSQNDGIRTMQRFRRFQESRLIALSWNGHTLVENWRTSDQSGYLSDFTLADSDNDGSEEIVMGIKFTHKGMLQKARSAIVSYEMN